MIKLLIAATIAMLAGCTTTGTMKDTAAAQVLTIDGKDHTIAGHLLSPWNQNEFTGELRIQRKLHIDIDSQRVIDGDLTEDGTGELRATWHGHKIDSACSSQRQSQNLRIDCMILVDGKRTVTLTF